MIIPCEEIVAELDKELHERVIQFKKQNISPKLVTILLGNRPEQLSFVHIKKRKAEKIGVDFEFLNLNTVPPLEDFLKMLQAKVADPKTSGIIIQHPLPKTYNFQILYSHIPELKEIE